MFLLFQNAVCKRMSAETVLGGGEGWKCEKVFQQFMASGKKWDTLWHLDHAVSTTIKII